MKTVGDLDKYIAATMAQATTKRDKAIAREVLAQEICNNPDMMFLLLCKSGFSHDELIIHKKVNQIMTNKDTVTFDLDPESFGGSDFPDFDECMSVEEMQRVMKKRLYAPFSAEVEQEVKDLYANHPELDSRGVPGGNVFMNGTGVHSGYDKESAWIQTHSGRRFNPLNPYVDAIVIQDIAHALSMQCRFSGHCKKFYSVAQHSVLVSYICDSQDALWGLLHDASEAYLVDIPRPLKKSGKFDAYLDFEDTMMKAICKRFGLPEKEPPSVKKADTALLATEARDLMSPLHPDWVQPVEALPFLIDPWSHDKAKDMFMKRFFELTGSTNGYE